MSETESGVTVPVHDRVAADVVSMRERVIVAPCDGKLVGLPPEVFTTEGEWVEPGQPVAEIWADGTKVEVRSGFRGWLMGMLALDGQPVHRGDALFWVWGC